MTFYPLLQPDADWLWPSNTWSYAVLGKETTYITIASVLWVAYFSLADTASPAELKLREHEREARRAQAKARRQKRAAARRGGVSRLQTHGRGAGGEESVVDALRGNKYVMGAFSEEERGRGADAEERKLRRDRERSRVEEARREKARERELGKSKVS